ncbi:MAG: hypothetical protein HOY71_15695, partial [Nonomuraea sp.]|nr:hypothetical protein [Nonomuraea sp.]
MELEPVTTHPDALGEGPVWHDGRLLWVDLPRGVLRSEGGDVLTLPPPVTAALPSTRGLVLVLRDRLVLAETGEVVAEVPLGGADRCNDAKTDPRGRIWVGTMGPGGALFRLDPNGPTRVLDGVR